MSTRSSRRKAEPVEDAEMADAPVAVEEVADAENVQEDAAEAEPAEEGAEGEGEDEEEEEEEPQRVRLLPGSTPTAASFEFLDESHTMGNALRFIIMKNPNVEFCAYAIPHPSEAKMNIRIQTYEGTAVEALEKGLRDLQDLCDVVSDKFVEARDQFAATQA